MKQFYSIAISLFIILTAGAQISPADSIIIPADTIYTKKFTRAATQLMTVQALPWSWNYFVRNAKFAKINFKSIGENLKPSSWEWDDNNFKTNQFAHPYHGNLYFNAFRTNGYSFWQSVPAAFAGSFIWETAGETHHPAVNDFINTSLGGISIGEISYRLSRQVVDNRQRGFKRQLMEVCGLLINPMNGLNRIIDGKWGRYAKNSTAYVPGKLSVEFNYGTRRYSRIIDELLVKGRNENYGSMDVQYGNPYYDHDKPFSSYNGRIELGTSDSANFNLVRIEGTLKGWTLQNRDSVAKQVLIVTMNYDYYHNTAFLFGAQSFNIKLLSRYKSGKRSHILTQVGGGPIILGAVPDAYLYYGEGRNYDYGPGLNLWVETGYYRKKFLYTMSYRGSWFHTLNGNRSSYFLHTITQDAKMAIYKKLSLEFEWGVFVLRGSYKDYPDIKKEYPYFRISWAYKFTL
ncbi:MAG: DUF3943 domain-containing protein [Ferruginibacter sp.]